MEYISHCQCLGENKECQSTLDNNNNNNNNWRGDPDKLISDIKKLNKSWKYSSCSHFVFFKKYIFACLKKFDTFHHKGNRNH